MAPIVPAIPAILGFIGTAATVTASLVNRPKKADVPLPKVTGKEADQELLDAQRRKGRLRLAGGRQEEGLLVGGQVGAPLTLGAQDRGQVLVGE